MYASKRHSTLACVSLLTCLTSQLCSAAADAFKGDARLAVRRSIHSIEMSLQDILADLTEQTGVNFYADETVRGDRATLIAHEVPLRESLAALASALRFEWLREGPVATAGYVLRLSPTQAREMENERAALVLAAAKTIREEAAAVLAVSGLTDKAAMDRAAASSAARVTERDPDRLRLLTIEQAVAEQLGGRPDWTFAMSYLSRLDTEAIVRAISSGTTEMCWPKTPGCAPFPEEFMRTFMKQAGSPNLLTISGLGEFNYARLRLIGELGRSPTLQWQLTLSKRNINGYTSTSYQGQQPLTAQASSSEVVGPGTLEARGDLCLRDFPGFRTPAAQSGRHAFASLGAALEALDAAAPVNVAADAFQSTRLSAPIQSGRKLHEVLSQIARESRHQWGIAGEFVKVYSQTYAVDRWAEPPSHLLAKWLQRGEAGRLELDDFADIASLPPQQLSSLMGLALRGIVPSYLATVGQAKLHLQMWSKLSRADRRKALAEGLAHADLSAECKALFTRAIQEPFSANSTVLLPTDYAQRQALSRALLRVEMRETRIWGVRKQGSSSAISATSRTEALRYFQQSLPKVELKDIQSLVSITVRFNYESDAGTLARSWVTLPTRWDDVP